MAQRLYQRVDMGRLEPGEFRVDDNGMGERRVSVACPQCGSVAVLDKEHTVSRAGTVTPRWPCASEACSYVDYLLLEEIV